MQPNPEFEADIRAAMAVPEPDPAFLSSLRRQVSRSATRHARHPSRLDWVGCQHDFLIGCDLDRGTGDRFRGVPQFVRLRAGNRRWYKTTLR